MECIGQIYIGRGIRFVLLDCFETAPIAASMTATDFLKTIWPKRSTSQILGFYTYELEVGFNESHVFLTLLPDGSDEEELEFIVSARELRKVCKWAVKKPRKAAKQLKLPTEEFFEQSLS